MSNPNLNARQFGHKYRTGFCTKCDGACQVPGGIPRLFHGTNAALAAGDTVLPGRRVGRVVEELGDDTHESVWMTPSKSTARHWAEAAADVHGGTPRVYEVSHPSPEANGEDYLAPEARVVKEHK